MGYIWHPQSRLFVSPNTTYERTRRDSEVHEPGRGAQVCEVRPARSEEYLLTEAVGRRAGRDTTHSLQFTSVGAAEAHGWAQARRLLIVLKA